MTSKCALINQMVQLCGTMTSDWQMWIMRGPVRLSEADATYYCSINIQHQPAQEQNYVLFYFVQFEHNHIT